MPLTPLIQLANRAAKPVAKLTRKEGNAQAFENDLLKLGAKPRDIKLMTRAVPRSNRMTLNEYKQLLEKPPTVEPVSVSDLTGGTQYIDTQRMYGNKSRELEDLLGPVYDETVFHLNPYEHSRLFPPSEDYRFRHYAFGPVDDEEFGVVNPFGFTLKVPEKMSNSQYRAMSELEDYMREYQKNMGGAFGRSRYPVDFGHFSDYLAYRPGYTLGHTRYTDMPKNLGNWRMIEELQSDLNPSRIDNQLRHFDLVLDDPLRDMLYVPPEVMQGKEQMMSSLAMADAIRAGKKGVAVPPMNQLAFLRSYFNAGDIPPTFRRMYGEDLDKRLKDAENLGLGRADVIEYRDIPKFMSEGPYSGREWSTVMNLPPWDIRHEPFRVFKFNEDASNLAEDLPMFKHGGLV